MALEGGFEGEILLRFHHHEQADRVEQADEGEKDERGLLAGVLVEDTAKGRRDQGAETDEGQGDAEHFAALVLVAEPVGDHGEAGSVGERGADALEAAGEEHDAVGVAEGEDDRGEEHDGESGHHGFFVAQPVDDVAREGGDEELDESLAGEEVAVVLVLALVVGVRGGVVDRLAPRLYVAQVLGHDGYYHHVQHVVQSGTRKGDTFIRDTRTDVLRLYFCNQLSIDLSINDQVKLLNNW